MEITQVDAVTRFLDRRQALLARLDDQLRPAETRLEAARVLCDYAGRELNLADCAVYLANGNGDGLTQVATWGPKRGVEPLLESRSHLPIATGVVGDCARQLRAQRVDDTCRDPRYVSDSEPRLSELSVPISRDGILLGVLDSEDAQVAFYDARYEQVFEAIAGCGAVHLWRFRTTMGGPATP